MENLASNDTIIDNLDSGDTVMYVRAKFLDYDNKIETLFLHDILEFKNFKGSGPVPFDKTKAYRANWYNKDKDETLQLRVQIAQVGKKREEVENVRARFGILNYSCINEDAHDGNECEEKDNAIECSQSDDDANSNSSPDDVGKETEVDELESEGGKEKTKTKKKVQVPQVALTKMKDTEQAILMQYKKNILCENNALNLEVTEPIETNNDIQQKSGVRPQDQRECTMNINDRANDTDTLAMKISDLQIENERLKKELSNAKSTVKDLMHEIDIYAAINKELQFKLYQATHEQSKNEERSPCDPPRKKLKTMSRSSPIISRSQSPIQQVQPVKPNESGRDSFAHSVSKSLFVSKSSTPIKVSEMLDMQDLAPDKHDLNDMTTEAKLDTKSISNMTDFVDDPPSPIYNPEDSERKDEDSNGKQGKIVGNTKRDPNSYEDKLKMFKNDKADEDGTSQIEKQKKQKDHEWKDNKDDDFLDELPKVDPSQAPEYSLGYGRKVKRKYLKWLLQMETAMKFSKNSMYVLYGDDRQISIRSKDGKNARKDGENEDAMQRVIIEDEENEIMERALEWYLRMKKPDIKQTTIDRELKLLSGYISERINQSHKDVKSGRNKTIDQKKGRDGQMKQRPQIKKK